MARKMKDSSIEWIGEIPENWETVRIKRCFKIISGSGFPIEKQGKENGDYPVCKASDIAKANEGGVLYSAANYLDKEEISGYNIVPKYSIIMPKIGEAMKKNNRAIVECDVLIDNNCQGLFPISIYFKYAYYLFKIIDMNWFDNSGTIPSVNNTKLINSSIPCPPIKEQKKISNKLDSIVDYAKDIKSTIIQEIQTLENYKKSVITEAVTKGLDKNVEMKDSGIEWIGEIPKHWKVVPLKRLAIYNQGTLDEFTKKDYEFEYIDISSVKYGKGILPLETMTFEKAPSRARRIVHDGDIIISTVRTYLKAIATVPSSDKQMIASTGFCVVRTNGIIEQGFLKYSVQSEHFISEIASKSTGVSYPAINSTDLVNIKVLVPTKSERLEIIKYLDKKTKLIDESIAIKQKQLETLEEYKKSLIYEYVTGKKEVKDGEET